MKILTLPVKEIRECENAAVENLGFPSFLLMENAGRGLADHLVSILSRFTRTTHVAFLCGGGKNGGDGFVAARHLSQLHPVVSIYLLADPSTFKGDALLNFQILSKLKIPIHSFAEFKNHKATRFQNTPLIIVDAMVGTGFHSPLNADVAAAIEGVNELKKFHNAKVNVVAVDIPTGLNGDDGPPFSSSGSTPIIMADVTITFGFMKKGLLDPRSKPYVGRVEVVDIGLPESFLKELGYYR